MSDPLSISLSGLNASSSRIANAASSIVKASSTGSSNEITAGLVGIEADKTSYAADAKVVQAVAKDNQTLLDILA